MSQGFQGLNSLIYNKLNFMLKTYTIVLHKKVYNVACNDAIIQNQLHVN